MIIQAELINKEYVEYLIQHTVQEYTNKKDFYSLQIQANIYTLLIELAIKTNKKII